MIGNGPTRVGSIDKGVLLVEPQFQFDFCCKRFLFGWRYVKAFPKGLEQPLLPLNFL